MPSVFITGKEHRFPLHLTQLKFALTSIINYASTILFELVTASPFPAPLLILCALLITVLAVLLDLS